MVVEKWRAYFWRADSPSFLAACIRIPGACARPRNNTRSAWQDAGASVAREKSLLSAIKGRKKHHFITNPLRKIQYWKIKRTNLNSPAILDGPASLPNPKAWQPRAEPSNQGGACHQWSPCGRGRTRLLRWSCWRRSSGRSPSAQSAWTHEGLTPSERWTDPQTASTPDYSNPISKSSETRSASPPLPPSSAWTPSFPTRNMPGKPISTWSSSLPSLSCIFSIPPAYLLSPFSQSKTISGTKKMGRWKWEWVQWSKYGEGVGEYSNHHLLSRLYTRRTLRRGFQLVSFILCIYFFILISSSTQHEIFNISIYMMIMKVVRRFFFFSLSFFFVFKMTLLTLRVFDFLLVDK